MLTEWQIERLKTIHENRLDYGTGRDDVTVLAYHFWTDEGYDAAFKRVECAVRETWLKCGSMKTVLVVNKVRDCVKKFAECFPSVSVQKEESLLPGKIFTMSADCNGKLYARFSTPYVLVVQNDGFPLRKGIDDFVGKYDFIGAPYIRDIWWKQMVCKVMNCRVQNGGFSLRSHELCEKVAFYWQKYKDMGDVTDSSEDIFYTQFLPLRERAYRRMFKFAGFQESQKFSHDAIVPVSCPEEMPFGFHGEKAFCELAEKFSKNFSVGVEV
jgi:hypothetical protein